MIGGAEKKIDGIICGSRAEVEHDMVNPEAFQITEEFQFLRMAGIGGPHNTAGTADELEIEDGRIQKKFAEILHIAVDKINNGPPGIPYSEIGMHIGISEIEVNRNDLVSHIRQHHGQIRGNEAFPHTAFPAAHRPDTLLGFKPISDGKQFLLIYDAPGKRANPIDEIGLKPSLRIHTDALYNHKRNMNQ
jgi:hypothetical protein